MPDIAIALSNRQWATWERVTKEGGDWEFSIAAAIWRTDLDADVFPDVRPGEKVWISRASRVIGYVALHRYRRLEGKKWPAFGLRVTPCELVPVEGAWCYGPQFQHSWRYTTRRVMATGQPAGRR